MNEGFEKAIEKEKMINFKDDEKRKTFIISFVIKYSLDRGIHFSTFKLITLYRKISSIFKVTFEEIFILNKTVSMNQKYKPTEEDTRTISLVEFLIKIFFKRSSK